MSSKNHFRILISGGGTGGHVYPGIAIANKLKELQPGIEIIFVGVKNRIESKIVPREGFPLKFVYIRSLPRSFGIKTAIFFFSLFIGLIQSLVLLFRYRPKAVIGTGGYVSWPVVHAASLLGIPTLIQEQNSYPGITTKALAPKVDEIHLAFEEAIGYLKKVKDKNKFKITGNPIRLTSKSSDRSSALQAFDLDEKKRTLLLFGGSQGAAPLNQALVEALPHLSTEIQIIWQTGETDFESMQKQSKKFQHKIFIKPFIYNMAEAYSAADLAFCRSGAITIAELVQLKVPAIFVPLPHAAEGHQAKNARVLVEAGAAEMILQHDLTGSLVKQKIEQLIFDEQRQLQLRENLKKFDYPDSAGKIANSVLQLAKKS
jgi:UDP-N-acetylglucosamine--N-acetylmuramyl-(pentapeptide) pyrophosphoryl-undecaprenol N-acetylglucosamine transferase